MHVSAHTASSMHEGVSVPHTCSLEECDLLEAGTRQITSLPCAYVLLCVFLQHSANGCFAVCPRKDTGAKSCHTVNRQFPVVSTNKIKVRLNLIGSKIRIGLVGEIVNYRWQLLLNP